MALAGPRLTGVGRSRLPWLVLTDVSASTRGQSDRPLGFPDGRAVERVDFAASLAQPGGVVDTSATNIAGPLRLAAARARNGQIAGVVIRTDGQFTDSDWRTAARALGEAGVAVTIVPLDAPPGDARVAGLFARRGAGDAVELRVTVAASAPAQRTLTVQRDSPGRTTLLSRQLALLAGDVVTIRLSDQVPPGNSGRYSAELSAGDAWAENDAVSTIVLPRVQRVMLLADGPPTWAAELAERMGVTVHATPLADAPNTEAGLADYAGVVVVDAAGDGLTAPQREAIGRYVRSGGGLVLVGSGPRSSPADRSDPLNEVAALVANPYDRMPLAVTVVLDASGSMARAEAGRQRFAQASEAVVALRRYLTDRDSLKVIAFSDEPRLVYDSGGQAADFAALGEALRGVAPAGATHAGAALELAAATSADPDRRGLIILVSDLMTEPFDVDATADALSAAEASLAIVAIGQAGQDRGAELLASLASAVDAPSVPLDADADLSQLAEIFGRFVRQTRGGAVRRGELGRVDLSSLTGAERIAMPPLDAYILAAVNGQDVEVYSHVAGDPVLAMRRAGLGRSVTLAVPLHGRDNLAWQQSPQTAELLAVLAEWSLRPAGDPRFIGQVTYDGAEIHLRIDASDDGTPINDLALSVTVGSDSDRLVMRAMRQTAPGRYELQLPRPDGAIWLEATTAGRAVWRLAAAGSYRQEFGAISPNWQRLRTLSRLTGGRIAMSQGATLDDRLVRRDSLTLWPALLAVGLALMLTEWVAARTRRRCV